MNYENFSKNIKWLRARHGLSQEKLAAEIEVNRPVIAQWERGKNGATIEAAERLCKKFSLSLDYLYFGDLSTMKEDLSVNPLTGHYDVVENCKNCAEKEKIITSQRETISALQQTVRTLNELMENYRRTSIAGEKRTG